MRENQENEAPLYATLRYEVLKKLKVSASEYMLLDMVYHLSAKHGFCYKTVSSIAYDLDLTFTGTKKMIKRLVDRELLIQTHSGLQCASAYIDVAYLGKRVEAIETELSSKSEQSIIESPKKSELSSEKVNLVQQTELSSDETNILELQKTISTNVEKAGPPKQYGDPKINEMFDYWQEVIGYPVTSKRQANRNACSNLVKKHGREAVMKFIDGVYQANGEKYSKIHISDFTELQSDLNRLLSWGATRKRKNSGGVVAL